MRTSPALVVLVLAGVGLLGAECAWLQRRAAARAIARANEAVASQVEAARLRIEAGRWDEAIRTLEEALAVERATERDEALAVLEQARRGQAAALLEAARLAALRKDADGVFRLLHAYETHPRAMDLDRARLLRADIERAVSGEEAVRLLARLSDEVLTVFARDGRLTADDGLHTEAARELFRDTLRRHLDGELRKRQEKREVERLAAERRAVERARRVARLRATPSFLALTDFVARTRQTIREQQERQRRRAEELALLFEQLDVNGADEQESIRADLAAGDDPAALRRAVEDHRTTAKRAYHTSPQFDADDRRLFDQLVDQELDALLALLPSS